MELNDRKLEILQAIIKNYLETAEPVGSRTISRKYKLGISSATIRNEMSDLEELGFIIQPHTSAGRIPSAKGYRLYVDNLMKYPRNCEEQIYIIKKMILTKVNQLDSLLKEIGDLLALMTNYTSMISTPQYKKTKLKHMQLIPLDKKSIILVIITGGNIVKNHIINTNIPLESDDLLKLSNMLNQHFQGLTLEEINLPLIQKLKKEMGIHSEILNSVLDAVAETIQYADDVDIYTSGTMNILEFPEFKDILKAKALINALEQKETVLTVLNNSRKNNSEANIQITIGEENNIDEMKDCSIITTTYKIGEKTLGTIGILGPTRMDYVKVVSTLEYLMKYVDPIINLKNIHKRE